MTPAQIAEKLDAILFEYETVAPAEVEEGRPILKVRMNKALAAMLKVKNLRRTIPVPLSPT